MMCRKGFAIFLLGFLILFIGLSIGCAPKSEITVSPGPPEELPGCYAIFPAGPWESVHKIEATFGGGSSSLIGVTKGEPSERRLQSVLLTPEGFVLFDAERRIKGVSVRRAVAPFDSPAFARGLIEDVSFLFFPPAGKPTAWGKETNGTTICKWENPENSTEITGSMDHGWRILRRNKCGEVIKEIVLSGPFLNGLASRIQYRAFKPAPYTLRMTLIQAFP
jgi:hypothetical protein